MDGDRGLPGQVPVTGTQAGLYEWKVMIGNTTWVGHVVVRGVQCAQINGWSYPQGTETWYRGGTTGGGAPVPTFTLKLALMKGPTDQSLLAAINTVRNTETEVGTAGMVPNWQSGAPLGTNPIIYTMQVVTGGPGQYGSLYKHVSMQMSVSGAPVMPTWYTDIANLYSIFGGSSQSGAPVQQGIEAKFEQVSSGNPGFPAAGSWFWVGATPA
jgi:hypothetical protein